MSVDTAKPLDVIRDVHRVKRFTTATEDVKRMTGTPSIAKSVMAVMTNKQCMCIDWRFYFFFLCVAIVSQVDLSIK